LISAWFKKFIVLKASLPFAHKSSADPVKTSPGRVDSKRIVLIKEYCELFPYREKLALDAS
jgi:hypothetical protein